MCMRGGGSGARGGWRRKKQGGRAAAGLYVAGWRPSRDRLCGRSARQPWQAGEGKGLGRVCDANCSRDSLFHRGFQSLGLLIGLLSITLTYILGARHLTTTANDSTIFISNPHIMEGPGACLPSIADMENVKRELHVKDRQRNVLQNIHDAKNARKHDCGSRHGEGNGQLHV